MDGCLDDEALQAALEARLPPTSPEAAHLATCRTCRAVLALARTGSLASFDPARLSAHRAPDRPNPTNEPPRLARGTPIGRYLVLDVLGAGAMGVVYASYDAELDRKIAIKVLTPPSPSTSPSAERALRAQLLCEAQAMARLTHTNVIRVYDVGEHERALFIAMELVEGLTLADWLAARPRTWREVLNVFTAAGHGLTAAHEAGLVHRDFKPANVLVRADGHVFVTDFGLARAFELASSGARPGSPPGSPARTTDSLAGAIVGTPAYMAPEVILGEGASMASDLFSFGVALYEGLYGRLPFFGRTFEELRSALLRGGVDPPSGRLIGTATGPSDRHSGHPARTQRVPRWLRKELVRALHPDPLSRPPSMRALTDALSRRPARTASGLVLGSVALAGALTFAAVDRDETPPPDPLATCEAAGADAALVWNETVAATVTQRLIATERPAAASAARLLARAFSSWSLTWADMQRDLCRATRLEAQPESLLAQRAACLARRKTEALATLDVVLAAEGRTPERAAELADSLDTLHRCADYAALAGQLPPPTPSERPAVDAAMQELAQATSLAIAGNEKRALSVAEAAHARARASGYLPVIAEAHFELGRLRLQNGAVDPARLALFDAVTLALAAHDDPLATNALLSLAHLEGYQQARFDLGHQHLRLAESLLTRMGGNPGLEATLFNTRGQLAYKQGDFTAAIDAYRRALELRRQAGVSRWIGQRAAWSEATPAPDAPPERSVSAAENAIKNNLANALSSQGLYAEALAVHAQVLESRLANEGPLHPATANTYNNLGFVLMERFRYDEALDAFLESLAIRELVLPPGHWLTGMSHANIGMALASLGHHERALDHLEHGLLLTELKTTRAHPNIASIETEIAAVHHRLGDLDAASAATDRAWHALDATVGRDHVQAARTFEVAGLVALERGGPDIAKAHFETALSLLDRAKPGSPALIGPLVGRGRAELTLGHPEAARESFSLALALSPAGADPLLVGEAAFGLLRARTDPPASDAAPAPHVQQAREAYLDAGLAGASRLDRLEAWLRSGD